MKIRVLLVVVFALFFVVQSGRADEEQDARMVNKIIEAYQEKSEDEFKVFIEQNKDSISVELVSFLAYYGMWERDEAVLSIAITCSEAKQIDSLSSYVYFNIGDFYYYQSEYTNAGDFYDMAMKIYEKTNQNIGQGNVWWRKGDICLYEGRNTEALEMYDKALPFYKAAKDPLGQGNVWRSKGDICLREGRNTEALQMYDKALPFFKTAKEPLGQGNVWKSKGDICLREGRNTEALEMYDKALPFFKTAKEPLGQGNVWKSKGDICLYEGRNTEALEMYDKALPFFEAAKDPLGQGNVWRSKGDICLYEGRNTEALKMYDKALPFFESAKEPLGQGNVWWRKGEICRREGRNTEALEMYDKALPFFESAKNPLGQGNVWRSKGDICFYEGRNTEALEMYDKALPFFESAREPLGQGNVWIRKGDICLYEGRNTEALEMYDKALPFFVAAKDPLGQGNVWIRKGDICLYEGRNTEALEMYDKALPFFVAAKDPLGQGNVWNSKALAFEKLNQSDSAYYCYKKGLSYVEEMRSQTGSIESRQSFHEKYAYRYQNAAIFMLGNSYENDGFGVCEQMKARAFLDMLAEKKQGLENDVDHELIETRDSLNFRISALQKLSMESTGDQKEKYENEISETKIAYDDVINRIRRSSPKAGDILYPEPIEINELQKVLKDNECILEYIISDSAAYCMVIGKNIYETVELKIPGEDRFNYDDFWDRFISDWLMKLWKNEGIHPTTELYEILIKPAKEFIAGKELIIIPDRILFYIPFEAILTQSSQKKYLVEDHKIKYFQSATLLAQMRQENKSEKKGFIGFGDPVFDYENYAAGKIEEGSTTSCDVQSLLASKDFERGGLMNRLNGSAVEVREIANIFGKKGYDTLTYMRQYATEENVKKADYSDYGYIFWSTHGMASPEFQGLAFSQLPEQTEDGFLSTAEIMGLRYDARLVTMSACQTGLGKLNRGEGMTGLTRAAMFAGADAVLSSLWSVSDFGTTKFMVEVFNKMINEGKSPENAIHETKVSFIRDGLSIECGGRKYYLNHPFFWSAFVLYGE
jgi:tetratricopeptide (TPR) repeat protein